MKYLSCKIICRLNSNAFLFRNVEQTNRFVYADASRVDMVPHMSYTDRRPYIWMLCGSFSFTIMAELAHVLTQESDCDWQTVTVFRAGLVTAFAAGMAWVGGAKLVFWPWRLWVRSVAGSGSMLCTFYAFGKLPTADVVTLTNTFPIWVAVLSWPLYGHAPDRKMVVAILIGVAGVVLVEQPHLESGNLGVMFALGAQFSQPWPCSDYTPSATWTPSHRRSLLGGRDGVSV